jgi:lipopolysaccharide biosynthesis glycosyltransferase
MQPVVEDLQMRPYFNAGILVTRPERRLFQDWYKTFLELYHAPAFQKFYEQDQRYIIFLHQAVLAGVVLHCLAKDELLELPSAYNYPVHLFEQDKTKHRPDSMDELVTFRHEGFYQDSDWMQKMPASERFKQWLAVTLSNLE